VIFKASKAAFLSVAVVCGAPTAVWGETLIDALVSAYNNSDLLEQQRAVLRAADEDVAQAVASLRPTLSYQVTERYLFEEESQQGFTVEEDVETYQTNLELIAEIALFTGGRNRLAIESAKEAVLAAREGLRAREQQVLFEAVDAYMTVLAARETVDLRENSVRLLEEEVRAARDRFEVGEVTRTDVAQAEAALAQAEADLVAAEGDLETAREDYNLQVGRYPGNLAAPPPLPSTAPTEDNARQVALRSHPQILQAQRNVTVAEINARSAEAAVLPTLSGQATAGYSDADETFGEFGSAGDLTGDASISLQLRGPIYQGGQLNSVFRQARAQRDNSRAQLLRTTSEISEQVGRAWAVRDVARARLQATARQIEAARIAFEGTREEATLGARTTLDVLDAEQDLLDAQTSQVDATAQEQRAVYGLLSAMGRLTVDYLNLPVTTYDPTAYYNMVKDAPSAVSEQGRKLDRVLQKLGKE
jgi:outer membrane protein